MSEDLLPYYERELDFIRDLAAEFAQKYPKIASRLQLEPNKCEDPHVERLIEAFALLSARIHRKIDDEFPEVTEALLNLLYPHYLRPIPSMSIAQLALDSEHGKIASRHLVPLASTLNSLPVRGSPCLFRTCYPVQLWPVSVTAASVSAASGRADISDSSDAFAVIRLELKCSGTVFRDLPIESLRFFLDGDRQTTHTLYELILSNVQRVVIRELPKTPRRQEAVFPSSCLRDVGFGKHEGMLPYSDRSFIGYRHLQEYFAFPDKFLFFEICELDRLRRMSLGERIEILIELGPFERRERLDKIEQTVTAETFRLGCTPIVNLFQRCAEPIRLAHTKPEYRVVPDVHNQDGTEVYSIDRVYSTVPYSEEPQAYEPFYSLRHVYYGEPAQTLWYATRRPSARKGDSGTEVYLSFTDLAFNPNQPAVETVTVHVTCTNRDLPGKLPFTGEWGEFQMESGGVTRIRLLRKPTEAIRPPTKRGLQWRLISHMALNHLSIVEGGRDALQEILKLYDFSEQPAIRRQIAGITGVHSEPCVARVASETGVAFCVGTRVHVEFDEEQFVGGGVFLLATALERFFGLYSAINSFSQLTATTKQRKGELKQWAPRAGQQILL